MTSLTIGKYNGGKETKLFIDIEKYRYYIDNHPKYDWIETVDEYYANVQQERKNGIIVDNVSSRNKLDFYFKYNRETGDYVFQGTYFDWVGKLYISFKLDPDKESMIELFNLAKSIDAEIYDNHKKIDEHSIDRLIAKNAKKITQFNSELEALKSDFEKFIEIYSAGYVLKEKKKFLKIFTRKPVVIEEWDYSIESAKNLQNIVIYHTTSGFPKEETPLCINFNKTYGRIMQYYIGVIFINYVENTKWNYFEKDGESTLAIFNENNKVVLFPGVLILYLLASEGKFNLVGEIRMEINKALEAFRIEFEKY